MTKTVFITGTDTDAGKTWVSALILKALAEQNQQTIGFKPIGSGGIPNPDAVQLQRYATVELQLEEVNPFCFAPPIAPHIAAAEVNSLITTAALSAHYQTLLQYRADVLLCEGAGGWLLPINDTELLSDWVVAQGMEVIMVVGMKLGCLNHALLTAQAIKAQGGRLTGWVANQCQPQPMAHLQQNIAYLKRQLSVPCLATVPYTTASDDEAYLSPADTEALVKAIGCNQHPL